MLELRPVSPDDEAALFAFEEGNRAYFAKSITDRGDLFFEEFPERHRDLLAEQAAGTGAFYVLCDEGEGVVGRFNLYDLTDATATVGYRVAERVSGRGVATFGLVELCRTAREELGLLTLSAVTSKENVASQRVLLKAGFAYVGPTEVEGREGNRFDLDLVPYF